MEGSISLEYGLEKLTIVINAINIFHDSTSLREENYLLGLALLQGRQRHVNASESETFPVAYTRFSFTDDCKKH